jgi:hypothetical protein
MHAYIGKNTHTHIERERYIDMMSCFTVKLSMDSALLLSRHPHSLGRNTIALQAWRLRELSSATSSLSILGNKVNKALTFWPSNTLHDEHHHHQRTRGSVRVAKRTVSPTFSPASDTMEKEGEYDVIVIGSGMGGLVASTELAVRGARVLLLEKYIIPGGSSAFFCRHGYTFDVGSSVMFGCGDKVFLICSPSPSIRGKKTVTFLFFTWAKMLTMCMASIIYGTNCMWNTFIWN